jgi:hypothetical protein
VIGRFRFMDAQRVNLDGFAVPDAALGLIAFDAPADPEPSLVVGADGEVLEMDSRAAADFDVLDEYIARHGIDLDVAAEAMALTDTAYARMCVDPAVPRADLVRLASGMTPAKLARCLAVLRPVELGWSGFWATVGGMGLTGIITEVSLRLIRIESAYMVVRQQKARNLQESLDLLHNREFDDYYTVAWLDCLGRGENFLASDLSALLKYTRRILPLEENEVAKEVAGFVSTEVDRTNSLVTRGHEPAVCLLA